MSEPIRIAQILNRMDSGGVEAIVMNYYRAMDRSKVQFDFYFEDKSCFPQREELERLGAGVYFLPSYKKLISYHRALYRAFRQRRYKIVHAQMSTLSVFPLFAAWRAGVPVRICHAHTTAAWGEGLKTVLKVVLRPLSKLFATEWFACGEIAGKWMYGGKAVAEGKVQIMPNGIDLAKFAFDDGARQAVRAEYGIPRDALVVGHVGRFAYQKNHAFLLQVFERLLQRAPDAYLLLLGEGELYRQVEQQARELGLRERVVFGGVRQDVAKCYSAMDVFCLPSFYEGVPVAAVEAQVNGLPCLCSDTVSREAALSRELVQLSLRQPAEEWAERLRGLLPARSTSSDGRRLDGWDIRAHAQRMQRWYETAAEADGGVSTDAG